MTSKNWIVVINNYTVDEMTYWVIFSMEKCKYSIVGFEVGEEGTPHMQGYISMNRAENRKWLKQHFPRAHFEQAGGNHRHNYEYARKIRPEDKIPNEFWWEHGEIPVQGRAKWDKIEEAMVNPKDNPHLFNQYHKTYNHVRRLEMAKNRVRGVVKWIYDISELPDDCVTIDTYDGESSVFIDNYVELTTNPMFKLYYHGKKATLRRGFELIPFVPDTVFVQTNDPELDGEDFVL